MLSQEKYEQAIEKFKQILKKNAKDPKVRKHLINCLFKYGLYLDDDFATDYEKAAQCYAEIIDLDEKNSKAWYNLGIIHFKQKNFDKAIEYYKKSLEIKPNNKYVFYNLGLAYEAKEDYKLSLSYYKKSLEIDPFFDYAKKGKQDAENFLKALGTTDSDFS